MGIVWNELGRFPANTGTLYMRMRVKVSSGWSNNGNGETKFIWPRPMDETGNAHYSPIAWGSNNLRTGFTLQGSYLGSGNFDYIEPNSHATGVWHDIEWLLVQGTAGGKDGTAKMWVDGVQVLNASGLNMVDAGKLIGWKYMSIAPVFGGGVNPVPADQYIWIDHWYASVK